MLHVSTHLGVNGVRQEVTCLGEARELTCLGDAGGFLVYDTHNINQWFRQQARHEVSQHSEPLL